MQAVRSDSLSINKASKEHNIPRGTIQNKFKNIHSNSVGHPTVFTKLKEELFARVTTMCNWGFPLDKLDLCMVVNAYLTKQNPVLKEFANNIPGDDWVANFMGTMVSQTELQQISDESVLKSANYECLFPTNCKKPFKNLLFGANDPKSENKSLFDAKFYGA